MDEIALSNTGGARARFDPDVAAALRTTSLTFTRAHGVVTSGGTPIAPLLRPDPGQVRHRNHDPLDVRRANLETSADRASWLITSPSIKLFDRADALAPLLALAAPHATPGHTRVEILGAAPEALTLAELAMKLRQAAPHVTPEVLARAITTLLTAPEPITFVAAFIPTLPALPAPSDPLEPPYPWETVDWSLSDTEIAQQLGAARGTVYKARKRHEENPTPRPAPASDVDWTQVDWSAPDALLAEQLGRARGTIYNQRQRHAPEHLKAPPGSSTPEPAPTEGSGAVEEWSPLQGYLLACLRRRAAINERILIRNAAEALAATPDDVQAALHALADVGAAMQHPGHPGLWKAKKHA